MSRVGRGLGRWIALLPVLALLGTAACGPEGPYAAPEANAPPAGSGRATPDPLPGASAAPGEIPDARIGRPARSTRIRFVPESLTLPGGARAPVRPAQTVAGELEVPEDVQAVGWWDGSAHAGDPFGSTVVAGHVDSATEGLGFFARLLRVDIGDQIALSGDGHRARYRVVAVEQVAQEALATESRAFDQDGAHRLVLITCTGQYRPGRGGYDSNLVVIATPVGRAR